ncbi:helix-turn-helix domain-containing protein [Paludisphaera sp.]|uniref:helix-turn-helix transcriptional regulator n=1 Tax=Paludisphaera sp. TaxID=2017432 RepID=UPI00301C974C
MAKKRTDAQRRVRQSDRLARVLRLLQLIQGPGNWNASTIARKLDCSERTVYRDLQTLSAAGIPLYFDDFSQSYRLREGYRGHFPKPPPTPAPDLDPQGPVGDPRSADDARSIASLAKDAAQRLLVEAEGVVRALDRLAKAIEDIAGPRSP